MSVQIDGSTGNIIATKADYSGNVSIGGTLTYEDVTNIDSVGLITARNGIKVDDLGVQVGTGATIDGATNILTFLTNGSERIRVNSTGNITIGTAASPGNKLFFQSSSGSAQCIASGGTNNQDLLIGTSSSEYLRIDSSGNVGINETSPSDFLHILPTDGKGITLKTTANHSAQITADCNRSAADNTILAIRGNWNGTGVAAIELTTSDDTSNKDDGNILFKTASSGGNVNQRMQINRNGQILINGAGDVFNSRTGFFNDNGGSSTAVQIEGSIYAYSSMSITRNGSGASGATFIMAKGQGGTTIINDDDTMGQISFQGAEGTGDMVEGVKIIAEVDGSPASNNMPGRLAFYTNSGTSTSTERLRIASDGKVLVGTDAGRSAGDVNGQFQIEGTNFQAASMNLISNTGASGSNNVHISLCKSRGSSDGSNTIVASEDNLGTIQWCGADGSDLNSVAAMVQAFVDGTPGSNDMPGRLSFWTTPDGAAAPTERMRITSGGNIGIGGVTDPEDYHANANSLVSGGGITLANTTQGSIYFADSASGTGEYVGQINYVHSGNEMTFVNNNSERMRFLSSGEIGFNCVSRPQSGVDGVFFDSNIITIGSNTTAGQDRMRFENPNNRVGSISATATGVNYNTSSDYRLKENVVDITDGITRVKQLSPRRFNFIADDTITLDGFLAHEAQTVVPEAVTGTHNEVDDDGKAVMQNIDQSKLVPLLTAALQEAIVKIETLEAKVAALEG